MFKIVALTAMILILGLGPATGQTVRPIEVVPPRPVTPMITPVAPGAGIGTSPTLPAPATPLITAPPLAVVPGHPLVAAQIKKTQPKKCWCYARNPTSNASQRTTCEIECCKGDNRDQRC